MIASIKNPTDQSQAAAHDKFLGMLPLIRHQARLAFRTALPEQKDELVAEVVANAYATFSRLVERGKTDLAYATPLAQFAIRQVCAGRRIGGTPGARDLMSVTGSARHGLKREPMYRWVRATRGWRELLIEDKTAGPAETAAARIDFATWLRRLPARARAVASALAAGESGCEAAARFGVSTTRISQLRVQLKADWEQFQAGAAGV